MRNYEEINEEMKTRMQNSAGKTARLWSSRQSTQWAGKASEIMRVGYG